MIFHLEFQFNLFNSFNLTYVCGFFLQIKWEIFENLIIRYLCVVIAFVVFVIFLFLAGEGGRSGGGMVDVLA